ncbi:MAG TPA: hypothetical protein VGX68_24675 [Thermoanaerobaculia bacterium]|jgi:hypothetical protein|nr:hypothetical protein [Thermoanaerobaculia bacterium]
MSAESRASGSWRTFLLYAGPLLLLLVLAMMPLVRGTETLILRDVLNSHFPMKWAQAEAMRHGYFPEIDPYRAGGQPLAGNLNAAPFYPDNLLFLLGSTFWAFNAHFWLHLLLAPFAFYWLARSWGLGREPSWAAAACWTVSGFYLSHLNFYNLIAGVTLAPALIAACLTFVRSRERRGLLAVVVAPVWTLLILGGDPQTALLTLLLAAAAVALIWRERPAGSGWRSLALLTAAFLCGTLIALPQLVEFLRILPLSYRGHVGYNRQTVTTASWDPRQAAEWLIPFLFGRPDVFSNGAFWGSAFFTGVPPYYLSLYPGLLTLALVAASGRPRDRRAGWAWGGIVFGVFMSLGRFNPLAEWLLTSPGQKSLRYPVKFWLPVAIGAALLCGVGFERLRAASRGEAPAGARRAFRWTLLLLALAFLLFWGFLSFAPRPAEAWLDLFIPRPAAFIAYERLRWAGLSLLSLGVLAALGLALGVTRRSWRLGGALLIAVHAAAQLWLLRPLYPMDAVVPYLMPPPALAWVPADLAVANPDYNYLFGPSTLRHGRFPELHHRWLERRSFFELYPFSGPVWGRRYELNTSPEGLDTFLTRMAQIAVKGAKDPERLRLLAAWGVGRLLLNHPLDPLPPHARLLITIPSFGHELCIYEVTDRAPEAFLARRIFRERDLPAVYRRLMNPTFDPRTDAVLIGPGPSPQTTGGGSARILRRGPESLEVATAAGPGGALLVIQRANLLFHATIDGRPARVLTANAHRIGVQVPAGAHRVRLEIDRAPLRRSLLGTLAGVLLLPVFGWWGSRRVQSGALLG